jgi:hypothetical protein
MMAVMRTAPGRADIVKLCQSRSGEIPCQDGDAKPCEALGYRIRCYVMSVVGGVEEAAAANDKPLGERVNDTTSARMSTRTIAGSRARRLDIIAAQERPGRL